MNCLLKKVILESNDERCIIETLMKLINRAEIISDNVDEMEQCNEFLRNKLSFVKHWL